MPSREGAPQHDPVPIRMIDPVRGRPWALRPAGVLAIGLVALTCLAYLPVAWNGFVQYDDDSYVTSNQRVRQGITVDNLRWALTAYHMGNWHPDRKSVV